VHGHSLYNEGLPRIGSSPYFEAILSFFIFQIFALRAKIWKIMVAGESAHAILRMILERSGDIYA
jgi:hypothetical protein